ncbi:uncharacterized protein LOC117171427 [Belonocnema kinseyi]|uniref:uncharacterized protein LOC117171427 n=1 Tax=Belonocnema kinseyi TaxID=2817044 RepID=UPI00143D4E43|nr:uncharacterized protein LOC117171427 [Belonocnema kinseyi]
MYIPALCIASVCVCSSCYFSIRKGIVVQTNPVDGAPIRNMRFRSPLPIIIFPRISVSRTILLIIGLLDIRSFAETSVKETEKIDSIMNNLLNNETTQNESSLMIPVAEKQSRIPHNLEHYNLKRETPHQTWNNSNSQNRSMKNEVLPLKNSDKIDFSKKPTLKNSGWLYNHESPTQWKREAYEGMSKSSSSETQQYHAQVYEDYHQQQQQKREHPKYVDGYNTIPPNDYIDKYRDYGNILEEQEIQKWRNSYYPSDGGASSFGCSWYKQDSTCQTNDDCNSRTSAFLSTLGMLGDYFWQLIQLMAISFLPFVIPILALKLLLVPLKIFKFLQLIKFFFKVFIVLPFIIRIFYPAISNVFGIQNLIGLENLFHSKPSHPDHHYHHAETREENNVTRNWHSDLEEYIHHYGNISGERLLQGCPRKVACELGSFLSASVKTKFPKKLANYLMEKAERAEEAEKSSKKDNLLESEKVSAVRAFIIAIGRTWSIDQCAVYTCSVIL